MTPDPLRDLRRYVEKVQASYVDPRERLRALGVVKRDLEGILGAVETYEGDARLQAEGGYGGSDDTSGDSAGASSASSSTTDTG